MGKSRKTNRSGDYRTGVQVQKANEQIALPHKNVEDDDENTSDVGSDDSDASEADDDSAEEYNKKGDNQSKEVIIILDLATLEIVKTKKGDFQLLNCDDHVGLMRKLHKDPQNYRPDIIHQELMAVLDSPLNKAGFVKVYVHTEKNVLIEINPKTRIPRTFKRFSGLMVSKVFF